MKMEILNIIYFIEKIKNIMIYDDLTRKCKGIDKYIDKKETIINKECSIENYHDHNYAKNSILIKR